MAARRHGFGVFFCFSLLGLFLLCFPASSPAAMKPARADSGVPRPASAIFIGNSFFYYNNSMHGHFNALVKAGDKTYKFRSTSATISGSGLSWHDVDAYFKPGGIGSYSFVGDNEVVFNDPKQNLFDLSIMLDCSQCPVHPTLRPVFFEYAKKHSATVRKHNSTPVLFMTWAYADKPEMTEQLADAYTRAGNENDALVIPAGLAFARAARQRPDVTLYVPDKRHPSLPGTYLGACTAYAALFKKSPVGLGYTAGLDPDVAKFLQTVAWETVQEYYAK